MVFSKRWRLLNFVFSIVLDTANAKANAVHETGCEKTAWYCGL